MKKKFRDLTLEQADIILESGEYGILTTIIENNIPYGVPVNYYYQKDKYIYFSSFKEGTKIEALKENPMVSFIVIGDSKLTEDYLNSSYESVMIEGVVEFIEGEIKEAAYRKLVGKYNLDEDSEQKKSREIIELVRIKIKKITAKGIK